MRGSVVAASISESPAPYSPERAVLNGRLYARFLPPAWVNAIPVANLLPALRRSVRAMERGATGRAARRLHNYIKDRKGMGAPAGAAAAAGPPGAAGGDDSSSSDGSDRASELPEAEPD